MSCCPRCSGFLFTSYDDTKCLQCGHRPPTFTANPKPVLADLRCRLCPRDRERGSEYCKQCERKRLKTVTPPKYMKQTCVRGHDYSESNIRFYMNRGRIERRCVPCERANAKPLGIRRKGLDHEPSSLLPGVPAASVHAPG